MSNSAIKVVIPMGGMGTRLRPQTWSKPKQLVSVAGKTLLDHVLSSLDSLPDRDNMELIGIVGRLGEQTEKYVRDHYPKLNSCFVTQENPIGQSHAIRLAHEYLSGRILIIFADTLIKSDMSVVSQQDVEAIAWVHPVADPRRFGVAKVGPDKLVESLIEKPKETSNNLAVVGVYYFREGGDLLSAIDEQIERNIQQKGEYFLVDAINIMLEKGLRMHTQTVETWLDAGTPEALLDTNRYLLEHSLDNSEQAARRRGIVIIPPVFVHPSAKVVESIIGPYVSLGAECDVKHSIIKNSILEDGAHASNVILENSLVGRQAHLMRRAMSINAGDNTEAKF